MTVLVGSVTYNVSNGTLNLTIPVPVMTFVTSCVCSLSNQNTIIVCSTTAKMYVSVALGHSLADHYYEICCDCPINCDWRVLYLCSYMKIILELITTCFIMYQTTIFAMVAVLYKIL